MNQGKSRRGSGYRYKYLYILENQGRGCRPLFSVIFRLNNEKNFLLLYFNHGKRRKIILQTLFLLKNYGNILENLLARRR